jgi:hypothetical protein
VEIVVGLGCLEGAMGVVVRWKLEGLVGVAVEIGVGLGCLEGVMGVVVGGKLEGLVAIVVGKLEGLVAIVVVGRRGLVTTVVIVVGCPIIVVGCPIIIIIIAAIVASFVVVPGGVPVAVLVSWNFLVGSYVFLVNGHGGCFWSFGSVEDGPSVVLRTLFRCSDDASRRLCS